MHDEDSTRIEAIDFEFLQQPAKHNKKSSQRLNSKLVLWFAFFSLILFALIIILFLPKYVAEKHDKNLAAEQGQIEPPPLIELSDANIEKIATEGLHESTLALSIEEVSALKQEAEEQLLQLINKQKLLESKAVKMWANEEFNIALTLGTSGDERFRKQEYQQAITYYKEAVMVLSDVEEQIAPILAEHLEKGELALTQAEKETAVFHFELAKSIETDNTQAINGLKRAETIEALYALLKQGGKLEAANHFADAEVIYQKATKLDPLSSEAKSALGRATNRLAQDDFIRFINQGYSAIKNRQYNDARAAFTAAQKLVPNSDKPKQGILSVEQAIRSEKLSALTAEAKHFENTQDWGNAVKSYQQILSLSSGIVSAIEGLERCRQRESILIRLNEHINNGFRLGSEQVANDAKQLLQEVAAINNPGSKIQQGAIKLKELILLANQLITITLQSDNQTDIAIFKVGKLGKFGQRKVELKTGKYTIVGSRSGFRDVRKVLTVSSDMQTKTIQVHCDEPI